MLSLVIQSCPTLWRTGPWTGPHGLQPARFLCLWNSLGKNTRVGIRFLLQGIFPAQGSNPGILHCRQIPYRLSHQGSPRIAEVRIKEIILMSPDSCIFPYLVVHSFNLKYCLLDLKISISKVYKCKADTFQRGIEGRQILTCETLALVADTPRKIHPMK